MTLDEFCDTLVHDGPPASLAKPLEALWWDAKGDWTRAHEAAQAGEDADSAWVHAYLHRKEGDLGNAGYWYRRAGRAPARDDLAAEWARLTEALLP
jgi:hypothetical protein